MKHTIYAMRDKLVGYGRPHLGVNDEVECRDFKAAMENDYAAGDKELYKIGTFDDETGEITPIEHVKLLEGKPHGKNEV